MFSTKTILSQATSAFVPKPQRLKERTYKLDRLVAFPGEDAPGIGRRHFPRREEIEGDKKPKKIDQHHLFSAEQLYHEFPSFVHTSCPLNVTDKGTYTIFY